MRSNYMKYVANLFTYLGSVMVSFGCVAIQRPERWIMILILWIVCISFGLFAFLFANGYFVKYFHHVFTSVQAIALAKKAYGTGNNDYKWKILYKDDRGYFVKAISQKAIKNGSMTGTAISCFVKEDGTVVNNVDNPFSN